MERGGSYEYMALSMGTQFHMKLGCWGVFIPPRFEFRLNLNLLCWNLRILASYEAKQQKLATSGHSGL